MKNNAASILSETIVLNLPKNLKVNNKIIFQKIIGYSLFYERADIFWKRLHFHIVSIDVNNLMSQK